MCPVNQVGNPSIGAFNVASFISRSALLIGNIFWKTRVMSVKPHKMKIVSKENKYTTPLKVYDKKAKLKVRKKIIYSGDSPR